MSHMTLVCKQCLAMTDLEIQHLSNFLTNLCNFLCFPPDENGKEYIQQVRDEGDKNHSIKDTECSNQATIYTIEDSPICPVKIFKLYLSKLNKL